MSCLGPTTVSQTSPKISSKSSYPGMNPAYVCNTSCNPADAGGLAIAYRAGARMVNLDVLAGPAGPTQFAR